MQTLPAVQSVEIRHFPNDNEDLKVVSQNDYLNCVLFWNKIHNIFNTLVIQIRVVVFFFD